MLTIQARDKVTQRIVDATQRPGNERYLIQRAGFPLLGQLNPVDIVVFDSIEMPALVGELHRVRASLADPADRAHVDAIRALAERCAADPTIVLIFNPLRIADA